MNVPPSGMREDYQILRKFLDKKVVFTYDTGAKIIGTITECKPAEGAVTLLVMRDVVITGDDGVSALEEHSVFSFVPNQQSFFSQVRE